MKIYGRDKQHPKGYPDLHLSKGLKPWWEGEMGDHSKKRERSKAKKEIKKDLEDKKEND